MKEVKRNILINKIYILKYLNENNIKLSLNDEQLAQALIYIDENIDYAVYVNGQIIPVVGKEYWLENYATAGKDNEAPNAIRLSMDSNNRHIGRAL